MLIFLYNKYSNNIHIIEKLVLAIVKAFDKEEARVVKRIYDWYLERYSIGGIINKLAEKKIKTSNLHSHEKSILEMWQLLI